MKKRHAALAALALVGILSGCGQAETQPADNTIAIAPVEKKANTESVLAGVSAASEACALVAVHDGARPLVSDEVITQAVAEAAKTGAAAPVVPVKDSIKRIENGKIAADVPRDTLAAVQTPQVFRRDMLLHALLDAAANGRSFTDDCAAVEALGQTVSATSGSYENIKVTTPEDIAVAEAFLYRREKK